MQLGSLQYPHKPIKGASEHFHFLSALTLRDLDNTVRNIDIDCAGYLRHSSSRASRLSASKMPLVASAPARATWLGF